MLCILSTSIYYEHTNGDRIVFNILRISTSACLCVQYFYSFHIIVTLFSKTYIFITESGNNNKNNNK